MRHVWKRRSLYGLGVEINDREKKRYLRQYLCPFDPPTLHLWWVSIFLLQKSIDTSKGTHFTIVKKAGQEKKLVRFSHDSFISYHLFSSDQLSFSRVLNYWTSADHHQHRLRHSRHSASITVINHSHQAHQSQSSITVIKHINHSHQAHHSHQSHQ